MRNIILDTDSYKLSHWKQYPTGTERIQCYFAARHGPTRLIGLQHVLEAFYAPITMDDVDEAESIITPHMGQGVFNRVGWEHIVRDHDGFLPIRIHAVPEGLLVAAGEPLLTVDNTCTQCAWVPGYIEPMIDQLWYPSTVDHISDQLYRDLMFDARDSGTTEHVQYALHDFGVRAVTSMESAAIGGMAHLLRFRGSDNLPAMRAISDSYWWRGDDKVAGYSIPASEHATMTAWGEDGELAAYTNMLFQFPDTPVAIVIDSYDVRRATDMWGGELKKLVLARPEHAPVALRLDSGAAERGTREFLDRMSVLYDTTLNDKGYRVLPPQLRVVWGDGLLPGDVQRLSAYITEDGYSLDNLTMGMGGGMLQRDLHRDRLGFTYKACWAVVKGEERDIAKRSPGKSSTGGRKRGGLLREVFADGHFSEVDNWDDIRKRVNNG